MRIGWISHQGTERQSNNDAAAIGRKDHYVLAMLVDAAEKGDGQGLARHWSRSVIAAAMGATQQLDPAGLISIMRAEQQLLRHHHLHAIASYCCALIDLQHQLLHIVHVGDCLLGIQRHGEAIDWLTRPHNVQDQTIWPGATSGIQESRHLLTRSLNARRFCPPDWLTTDLPRDVRILLCSDGYWHEHLHAGVDLQSVLDDASVLSIEPGAPDIQQQTDCDNFAVTVD
ncbi:MULTISPECIES: hypothetical protein [Pseudomonas]|uniref:Serine/threonine protein phosphatase n=1 Tax=Pseudomonas nitroreducens TaxID=46680 RepID=A0A6G6J8F0_PSENT|nr:MULTISPECIES: hypothetical protein [Pseudomonas]MDU4255332.1 hypothetical protein [Pseudomonas sp.]QIE91477.1 hypothetical protein G5B91_34670 [Pseudomonas nitroreducens]HBO6306572.1 hypothetical protein [Pseudomonas aeruginosa]